MDDIITQSLMQLSSWQQVAFCVHCAERISPQVRILGGPLSLDFCQQGLDISWDSVLNQPLALERLITLGTMLDSLPEMSFAEDANTSAYAVMTALLILFDTFKCIETPESEISQNVSDSMFSIKSGYDFVFKYGLKGAQVIAHQNPPDPGPLEQKEGKIQLAHIENLKTQKTPTQAFIRQLRQSIQTDIQQFSLAVEKYKSLMNW